jgi:2-keto-3-deoxy-L-rhamnonate aldolase RhmA
VSIDGIDGVVIGPMDLSISLGIFKQFEHPTYLNAVEKVQTACQKHHKAMGTACYSYTHAQQCMALGYSLLLVGGDDQFLVAEARRWLETLRAKGTQLQ